jgi:hypothetical protein
MIGMWPKDLQSATEIGKWRPKVANDATIPEAPAAEQKRGKVRSVSGPSGWRRAEKLACQFTGCRRLPADCSRCSAATLD